MWINNKKSFKSIIGNNHKDLKHGLAAIYLTEGNIPPTPKNYSTFKVVD